MSRHRLTLPFLKATLIHFSFVFRVFVDPSFLKSYNKEI